MTAESIHDHKALSCSNCGSVNYSLLQSGLIECNKCQDKFGHWLSDPINPESESDVRAVRIAAIEDLKSQNAALIEAAKHISDLFRDVPDFAAVIPASKDHLKLIRIKKVVNQMIRFYEKPTPNTGE